MNDDDDETVTISRRVYNEMLSDRRLLDCLQEAGVDNWEGYGEAIEAFISGE